MSKWYSLKNIDVNKTYCFIISERKVIKVTDKDLNQIGVLFISYKLDNKAFNKEIDKLCDVDLYSLYEKKRHIQKVCDHLLDVSKDVEFNIEFRNFRCDLLKSIDTEIYSREIKEKYEDKNW